MPENPKIGYRHGAVVEQNSYAELKKLSAGEANVRQTGDFEAGKTRHDAMATSAPR